MKPKLLMTFIAASVLFTSPPGLAQTGQDGLRLPQQRPQQPQQPALPMFDPLTPLPYGGDPPLPNRRIPSLTSPRSDDVHPLTPDDAWPKDELIRRPRPAIPDRERVGPGDNTFPDPGHRFGGDEEPGLGVTDPPPS